MIENSVSYELAKQLFEHINGYPPQIIEGNISHELIVAALQKGIVHGSNFQMEKMFSNKEVEKILISCKDHFGGSGLEDYTYDEEVVEWFQKFKK